MQSNYNFFNALKWDFSLVYFFNDVFPLGQELITELHLLTLPWPWEDDHGEVLWQ